VLNLIDRSSAATAPTPAYVASRPWAGQPYRGSVGVIVLILSLAISGCATTERQFLNDAEVPREGRFGIVIAESGTLIVEHDGTTPFTSRIHAVPMAHDLPDTLKALVLERLQQCAGCTYVPLPVRYRLEVPRTTETRYGQPYVNTTDAYDARHAAIQAELPKLADAHGLDFIIVMREWGGIDANNVHPVNGYGVVMKSLLGSRYRMYAYVAYELQVYDHATGRSRFVSNVASERLPLDRWIEFELDIAPATDTLEPYVEDVKRVLRQGPHLSRALCMLGPTAVSLPHDGASLFNQCRLRINQ
jgi:hypothetical protein